MPCNGYFTAMIGPGLLYDGYIDPFLPSCDWRNSETQHFFAVIGLNALQACRDLAVIIKLI